MSDNEKLLLDLSRIPHVDAHMPHAAATMPAPLLGEHNISKWTSRRVKC
jgi:hypothetical protein